MKNIKLILSALLIMTGLSAHAQEQVVEAQSATKTTELALATNPKFVIGASEVSFTDRKNTTTFSASERIVLRIKTKEAPAPTTYTITATSANTSMGSVTGGGTYEEGKTVTLTATPKSGYRFVKWSDGSTANPYTFKATKNVTLTATFEKIPPTTYTITATSANTSMGSVSGGGTYEEGKTVTLTATPKSGYRFVKWSDGTTANPYTFKATKNVTLTATFEKIPPTTYTITATSANTSMGTVSGGGTYEEGKTVTLTATPKSGYKFVKWSDGSTKNPYTFTATKNVTLTATFEAIQYTISATSADASMGTVSGGGTYKHGATVTLTATPKSGYKFVKWSDGTTKNPYTFTATKNVTLTANFMPLTDGVSVTTTDNGQQTITFDMQGRRQDSDVRGLIIQQRKKVLKH